MLNSSANYETQQVARLKKPKSLLRAARAAAAVAAALCSVAAHASYPIVRNFPRESYGAGTQNWSIAQGELGQVYFGNNDGLLRFDSDSWTVVQNSNYTTIRSVYVDHGQKRIYAGGSEDFGYYTSDSVAGVASGLRYVSLVPTLTQPCAFNEIWNIRKSHSTIWFQGDFTLFKYDGKRTETLTVDDKIATSQLVNNILTFATFSGDVFTVIGDQIRPMSGCEPLRGMRIVAILPLSDNKILFVTASHGIFIHNGAGVATFDCDINQFLKENYAFCATTDGKNIVVGTVNCGAVIKDLTDNSSRYVNIETGLLNNTVLSAQFDASGNVWLGLDNGISYVMCNSPINNLTGSSSLYGAGYTSLLTGNNLYLGTNQGLFLTRYPSPDKPSPQILKPILGGQVWSISDVNGDVFACTDGGIFFKKGGNFNRIDGIPGSWGVIQLKSMPEYALVSSYKKFHIIKRQKNGFWTKFCTVEGYDDPSGNFFEDDRGYIWVSHWRRGVYRLRFSRNYQNFDETVLFNASNGLPADQNVQIQTVDQKLSFSTEAGHYRYNYTTGTMEKDSRLNQMCTPLASKLYQSPEGHIWSVSPNIVRACFINSSSNYDIDSVSFMTLREKLIPGFTHITFTSSHKMIVSNQDGFYELNPYFRDNSQHESGVYISRIFSNQDSVIYTAGSLPDDRIKIPYNLNSLRFEFVMPEYRAQNAVTYSCHLDGYDQHWSNPSTTSQKEYTHIHEGSYTMRVRAYNSQNGQTSECAFNFTITPPWHRSGAAIACYIVMLLLLAASAYLLARRSYRRVTQRMAQRQEAQIAEMKRKNQEQSLRKEAEITRLKNNQLEADFKHKSEELSNTTMNVIRKNEILMEISDRIAKIKDRNKDNDPKISAINRQLAVLQKLIRENISHDDDWKNFTLNFDIVYGNYIKRLNELHPNLNTSEQRLCSYLKMGLSSKEIAPLLNISFRSVEMARYRLRKKLALDPSVNLAEYLQKL